MQTIDLDAIGFRISQKRKEKNVTQEELAEKAELSRNSINSIETRKANFSVTTLIAICQALSITPNDLLCDYFPASHFSPGEPDADFQQLYMKYQTLQTPNQKKCLQLFELVLAQYCGDEVSINVKSKNVFRYR